MRQQVDAAQLWKPKLRHRSERRDLRQSVTGRYQNRKDMARRSRNQIVLLVVLVVVNGLIGPGTTCRLHSRWARIPCHLFCSALAGAQAFSPQVPPPFRFPCGNRHDWPPPRRFPRGNRHWGIHSCRSPCGEHRGWPQSCRFPREDRRWLRHRVASGLGTAGNGPPAPNPVCKPVSVLIGCDWKWLQAQE